MQAFPDLKHVFHRATACFCLSALLLTGCAGGAGNTGESLSSGTNITVVSSGEAVAEKTIPAQTFTLIDDLISSDVSYGFPGAQLAVMKNGEIVHENAWGSVNAYEPDGTPKTDSREITKDTLFDLASVTKMFSATYALQKLVTDGKINPDTLLTDIFGSSFAESTLPYDWIETDEDTMREWKTHITIRHLLCHEAGMPPDPRSFRQFLEVAMTEHTREDIREALFRVPLTYEPETDTVYSDLDYMLLGLVVEEVTGMPLDQYMHDTFFEPMGLSHITYKPLENGFSEEDVAATELNGNTRDGHVSRAGIRTYTLQGEAHDENAFHAMDGVSGHAGLFANASDLARLASLMFTGEYDGQRYFSKEVLDLFTAPKNEAEPEWGLGWWRAGGRKRTGFFSRYASDSAIGHNGWTGTLVIIDPEETLVIVYLTNRINSPVTDPSVSLEDFDGGWFSSGILSTVPGLIYEGLHNGEISDDALMQTLARMVRNSFKALPEGEDVDTVHPAARNTESKLALYRKYAEKTGDDTYLKTADTLDAAWLRYRTEKNRKNS